MNIEYCILNKSITRQVWIYNYVCYVFADKNRIMHEE